MEEVITISAYAVLKDNKVYMGMGTDVTEVLIKNKVLFDADPEEIDSVIMTGTVDELKAVFKEGIDYDITDEELNIMKASNKY